MATIPSAGALPFSALFSRSFVFLKAHMRTILWFAVLLAVMTAVAQLLSLAMPQKSVMAPGLTTVKTELDWAQVPLGLKVSFILLQFVTAVAGFMVHVALWDLAVGGRGDAGGLLRRSVKLLPPFLGLYAWMFWRSYAWLMAVGLVSAFLSMLFENAALNMALMILGASLFAAGVVCSILYSPRFAAAQLLYLRDGMRPAQAADESFRRTKGYWGKVVGNLFLATVCMIPLTIVASILSAVIASLSVSGLESSQAAVAATLLTVTIVNVVIQGVVSAFMVFFGKELAATILEHPRAA